METKDIELLYQVEDKKCKEFAEELKDMEYNFFTTYTEIHSYIVGNHIEQRVPKV